MLGGWVRNGRCPVHGLIGGADCRASRKLGLRHRSAGRLLAAGQGAMREERHAADLRRGPDRLRPTRPRLRLSALRRRARYTDPVEDPRWWIAAVGGSNL